MTFLVIPRRELAARIAVGVLLVTCVLEFLQLGHPPWLQAIRSAFVGASLLGTSFSWWDFPACVDGAVFGWVLLRGRAGIQVSTRQDNEEGVMGRLRVQTPERIDRTV